MTEAKGIIAALADRSTSCYTGTKSKFAHLVRVGLIVVGQFEGNCMKDLIPSFPTDNLYKFVSLFGLFLFAGFNYLRIHDDFAFRREVVEFNTRAKINCDERAPEP